MKKLTTLIAVLVMSALTLSCSKDDSKVEDFTFLNSGKLSAHKEWVFKSAEIIQVDSQSTIPKSDEELLEIVNKRFSKYTFSFNKNGTGYLDNDGEGAAFNYKANLGEQLVLNEDVFFENFEVSENEFKGTRRMELWKGESNSGNVAIAYVRSIWVPGK